MKKKLYIASLALVTLLVFLGSIIGLARPVQAIQVEEAWGAPTFIYGGGLTQEEIQQTKDILNISGQNIEEFPVTGEDIYKYLGQANVSTSSMISSVLVERQGQGVNVNIATPDHITKVTAPVYQNAAITAGVTDVTITVASPRPVTGESALTGVYKAFEVNGETLDQDRMATAQEEVETTSDINQHLNVEQAAQFTQVIVNIKQEINNFYQQNNTTLTVEDLRVIIMQEINEANLDQLISQEQIDRLVNLFTNYQQTDAVQSEEVQQQLSELGGQLQDIYQEAKDSGLLDRLWQALVDFFNAIFTIFQDSESQQ